MQDETTYGASLPASVGSDYVARRSSHARARRSPRLDWRQDGFSTGRRSLVADLTTLIVLTVAVCGTLATRHFGGAWGASFAVLILWAGLLSACAITLARHRPRGLFRFRVHDLVWGFACGLALRLTQGALSGASEAPFPRSSLIGGSSTASWAVNEALALGILGPVVEELLFRAVILVSAYQLLRRWTAAFPAALAALLISAGLFALLHAALAEVRFVDGLLFLALGGICSALVLLTGRVGPAIIAHLAYNSTFVMLVLIGSLATE